MSTTTIVYDNLNDLVKYLKNKERSPATIEKYRHDAGEFISWLDRRPVTVELASEWKQKLLNEGRAPSTVNCRVAAVNSLFESLDLADFKIHSVRQQRRIFRSDKKDLSKSEYKKLLSAARKRGDTKLLLLFKTICSTGIRVSEVKYLTVEAVKEGCVQIYLKGKVRAIILTSRLCKELKKYAKSCNITSGEIFRGKNDKPISRKQIWVNMKRICSEAGVDPQKVFPHNLRHLFARQFYKKTNDIVKLADVLGHSSLSTTRIYLISTGEEHRKALESLNLLC